MNELTLFFTAGSLAYVGVVGWCLSQKRHQQQVLRRTLSSRSGWTLRGVGTLFLAASLSLVLRHHGGVAGAAAWCGLVTFSNLLLISLLPYAPRLAVALSLAGMVGAFAFRGIAAGF